MHYRIDKPNLKFLLVKKISISKMSLIKLSTTISDLLKMLQLPISNKSRSTTPMMLSVELLSSLKLKQLLRRTKTHVVKSKVFQISRWILSGEWLTRVSKRVTPSLKRQRTRCWSSNKSYSKLSWPNFKMQLLKSIKSSPSNKKHGIPSQKSYLE